MTVKWQPTIAWATLQHRAAILNQIRDFFKQRGVLEVETPLLSHSTVTDPHLHSFTTNYHQDDGQPQKTLYLQTSPEFAMKRLLAAGSGPIYQIARAFRNNGEHGRWHNPEFTLLEWYRPGFKLNDLMDETECLLRMILQCGPAKRYSYAILFKHFLDLDPHTVTVAELQQRANQEGICLHSTDHITSPTDGLQLLLEHIIQSKLDKDKPIFIYDFPASQAALARIRPGSPPVAERVEVYFQGLELANGFYELSDAKEQRQRFLADLDYRKAHHLPCVPIDEHLLNALSHGLPDCSGIALGIDRLVALATHSQQLAHVITFPLDRA
jgi:lysyl-tRNA synthetase class 2